MVEVNMIESEPSWITPLKEYLMEGTLPGDGEQAQALLRKVGRFTLVGGRLYKRSYEGPLLKCVGQDEVAKILKELHDGICGSHIGCISLVRRALRGGYFSPGMMIEAKRIVKNCDTCQRFTTIQRVPAVEMTPVTTVWPFFQWGLDILGPFPNVRGQ